MAKCYHLNNIFFIKATSIRSCLLFIAAFLLMFNAIAGDSLSLDGAIKDALSSNPEILAAKRSYEAASARIWQSASLNDPMLEFEYDRMTADRMLSGDPMSTYAVSQDIPLPTKLYLRAKISAKLAKMAYEDYRAKEREIISEVKNAYSDLFFVYKTIDIAKEGKSILEQVSASATAQTDNYRIIYSVFIRDCNTELSRNGAKDDVYKVHAGRERYGTDNLYR